MMWHEIVARMRQGLPPGSGLMHRSRAIIQAAQRAGAESVSAQGQERRKMGPDGFRRIALGMEDAIESAHMGHPDFRVKKTIFATLHHDHTFGMVKLTREQQQKFVREHPTAFAPENGAWGRAGCTSVRLDSVDEDLLGEAMTLAWQNVARRNRAGRSKATPSTRPSRSWV
jgi:hypothetical protein